ncbi:MAG: D-aminoacyl-tRNA deacylase [Peptostreptococcaceae bacterium]|nr:D-aminoacyl-tRNA deacylase [Peptostreptococcaceae bacterium]
MRAVIQRVRSAGVTFEHEDQIIENKINKGFQVMLGITQNDDEQDLKYIIDKILGLRVFEDENEKMNLSIQDVGGEILLISQFTLYGDARKGKRPSFTEAAKPDHASPLYEKAIEMISRSGITCRSGKFGADMLVQITNDGPVTILLDSKKTF